MTFDKIISRFTPRITREQVNLVGFIQSFLGNDKARCRVVNLSAGGARLELGTLNIDPQFTLHVPDRDLRRECRLGVVTLTCFACQARLSEPACRT